MPDAESVIFWQQVASIYKNYSNVLFELYNEPHPPNWYCWASPCTITDNTYSNDCHCTKRLTFLGVGMQALVNAVRKTGATNLVLVAGMDWGFDLSQVGRYSIKGSNLVYDTHL
jgi:endoglucanase